VTSAAAVLIPAIVGLALWIGAPALVRRLGAEAAAAAAGRAVLAAAVLAILLFGQVLRRGAEVRLPWLHVGRTTKLDWAPLLDPLALLVGGAALLGLLLAPIAGAGEGAPARAYARVGLAAGGALLLACAGSLWQAGAGVALAALACGAWPGEPEREDMPAGTWSLGLVAGGLAIAAIAWIVGAGDLDFAQLGRTALGQGGSDLLLGRVGGPFGGLAPAAVAGAAAMVAALGWALAWPRLLARAWDDGAAATAVASLAVAPAITVVLLRGYMPLALAPTVLAMLALGAGAIAARGGWTAARAASEREAAAASGQVGLAIAAATIGLGGFAAAARWTVVFALATAAVALARASGSRRGAVAVAGVAGVGLALAGGEAIAALASDLSAWSPAINVVTPLLALAGLAGAGAGWALVLTDRVGGTGREGQPSGPLLVGSGAVLAIAAAVVGGGLLADGLAQVFLGGRLLIGAFALGPRPDGLTLGTWPAALLAGLALAGGALLAGRLRPAAPRPPRRAGGPHGGVLRAAEAGLRWLVLRPGDERVAEAPRGGELERSLLVAVAGLLAILGSVFCNPDVVVLGPTRVHPVDLGGLDAAIHGSRRDRSQAGGEAAEAAAAEEAPVPIYAPDAEGPSRASLLREGPGGVSQGAGASGQVGGSGGMSQGTGANGQAGAEGTGSTLQGTGASGQAGAGGAGATGPAARDPAGTSIPAGGTGSMGQDPADRTGGAP
jgi:hypothetical protein